MKKSADTRGRQAERIRRRRGRKTAQYLHGALEVSADAQLNDPVWLLRTLTQFPDLAQPLENLVAELENHYGRRRLPGNWPLLYLGFVLSGFPDIKRFHDQYLSSPLWELCGFDAAPHHNTTYLRFTELEEHAHAFTEIAAELIQRAMRQEDGIGRHVHVDSTGFRVNARMYHCCPDPEHCSRVPRRAGGTPIRTAPADEVRDRRHEEAEVPAEQFEAQSKKQLSKAARDDLERTLMERQRQRDRRTFGAAAVATFKYKFLGEPGDRHLYRWRDKTAGVRRYEKARGKTTAWRGGYGMSATDGYTGAPIAYHVQAADVPEFIGYPDLMDQAIVNLGQAPIAAVTDRGFSFESCYRYNTTHGIGSVLPWRQPKAGLKRHDYATDDYDGHGVAHCKHCGGRGHTTGSGLGFVINDRGQPVIRFRCEVGFTPKCAGKVQTLSCSANWRLLGPLNPTDELYHRLRRSHRAIERVHGHWRRRYKVAGMDFDNMPKRLGIATQRLRAAAAMLLEWFRLCLRNGWLASHRRPEADTEVRDLKLPASYFRVIDARMRHGLDLPRGAAARKLGLEWPDDGSKPPPFTLPTS